LFLFQNLKWDCGYLLSCVITQMHAFVRVFTSDIAVYLTPI